jgi:signal transduction histidine kinase
MFWTRPSKISSDSMTLTNRVSQFFLIALAAILVGYSISLYALARYYLFREFDQQLRGTLNTLVAAIEVETDDVKWEPGDHTVTLGSESDTDDARWVVVDEAGQIVDKSANLVRTPDEKLVLSHARRFVAAASSSRDWRFVQAQLSAPMPKPVEERDLREHAVLVVTAARSTSTLDRTLNGLAALVSLLSVGAWSVAAVAGRWFCRKALEPVGRMAASARTIGPANPHQRLPVATSNDELSDLGQAFNDLLDQLFQAYQRQQRFAGDAAHQLRTPLTVLQGQIEVAARRQRTVAEYAETLSLLSVQVNELRQIVESLLFLARAEDECEEPPGSPVELSEWLHSYLEKWKSDSRYSDLRLQTRTCPTCHLSTPLLTQLLDNLVSNAFKYSSPGSPVTIGLLEQNDVIELAVTDRGIGISHEDIDFIFEPFFRSEAARRTGKAGTGLGLTLAARIARTFHGHITCDSKPGEGTQFTLHFPVHPASAHS